MVLATRTSVNSHHGLTLALLQNPITSKQSILVFVVNQIGKKLEFARNANEVDELPIDFRTDSDPLVSVPDKIKVTLGLVLIIFIFHVCGRLYVEVESQPMIPDELETSKIQLLMNHNRTIQRLNTP